ncbi:MAG: pyridoxamine 5'-phosphate oxidase family protein, partial [Acidimicrobiaceae bacterium]|nr:pyridoxamine 5'-phosphate oxidase family protein [Acidimicrobiaceae bacterium]
MRPEDIDAFLERSAPPLVGVIGTTRSDGAPHVVPVWYRWDGTAIHVWTGEDRRWVRNLRREPRAAFS